MTVERAAWTDERLDDLRATILRVGVGVMIGLVGAIAAVLSRGV